MTDKEKIRAEIERRISIMQHNPHKNAALYELKGLLSFIDSMQEEPVNEDLEKEIYNEVAKLHTAPCYDELANFARHFANWQIHQMMKDAVIMEAHEEYGELWGDIRKCNTEKGKEYKVIIIKEDSV